ncbi:/ coaE / Dephospho-CoA kinase /:501258 Reverse [Candidatus Hepatoplasma crinochetorum]|uniref:Dephospho-CoA kinase n=1 Tax=Candidatus Hepatoplasma crinochetorum TaxID=295596 RepID=A0A0G7ZLI9_9MOLU|nr:/ coaE / Dephospho-CoA kinase /:501258 Reverse [Candidatus Hepatoplasma crinochetorum]
MIIALTGSPFAGKTTILKKLQKKNIKIFHTDSFVKKIYLKGGEGYKLIEKYFGKKFVTDQAVDRKKLGIFVTKNTENLRKLNELIHPIIKNHLEGKDNYVAELPIISSSPIRFNYDKLILIKANKEEIIRRAKSNNSYYPFIEEMINQWDKLNIKFDYVIDTTDQINDQDLEYIKNLLKNK